MAPENSIETDIAIISDQTTRTMKELEKLEDKIDRFEEKVAAKFDYNGSKLHQLSNSITRLEAESKSNNKWIGYAIAGALALGDILFKLFMP